MDMDEMDEQPWTNKNGYRHGQYNFLTITISWSILSMYKSVFSFAIKKKLNGIRENCKMNLRGVSSKRQIRTC